MPKINKLVKFMGIFIFTSLIAGCSSIESKEVNPRLWEAMESNRRKSGASELYIAIFNDDLNKIKALVSSGADIDRVLIRRKGAIEGINKNVYQSALEITLRQFRYGVTEKRKAIVSYLLEQGADANGSMFSDYSLKYSDESGTLAQLIKPYRTEGRANRSTILHIAQMRRDQGASELTVAIKSDDLEKVKHLVLSGADIDQVLVMRKGANKSIKEDIYFSAVHIAFSQFFHGVTEKRKAVVSFLLEQGADVNGIGYSDDMLKNYDKSGALALLIKPYREERKINRVTLKASERRYRKMGYSELALAIKRDDLDQIKKLVTSGDDIHKVPTRRDDKDLPDQNQPAIELAAAQFVYGVTEQRISIVRYFLAQGANTNSLYLTDDSLNMLDKTGALSAIIIPYRNNTAVATKSENKQTTHQTLVAVAEDSKAQQIEFDKMRMEIARLDEQVNVGQVVNNSDAQLAKKRANSLKLKRVALVIGNSNYAHGTLINPANDANDIANALQALNFEVTLKVDVNHEQMEVAIDKFSNHLSSGGIGLFYYAGHGVQVKGENYLIPIGAKINKQSDVRYKTVNLGQVLDGMGEARNGLNVAILDACRNNPLPLDYRSSGNRGLARVSSPAGTLLAFATAPGNIASDGEGRNGLYTRYLLKHMMTKGISIERMLKLVSRDVKQASKNKQTPWMESSFTGDFFF